MNIFFTVIAGAIVSSLALTDREIGEMKCADVIEATSGLKCEMTVRKDNASIIIKSNGVPDHQVQENLWGSNPNSIMLNDKEFIIPLNPTKAATPSCLPMGTIGLLKNGVSLFNPFDVNGRDASVHEDLDSCGGHPQQHGVYHYHHKFNCMGGVDESDGHAVFLGVAMDGFPIYSKRDESGVVILDSQLDTCRGMTVGGSYRYIIGDTFPYGIACLSGHSCVRSQFGSTCNYDINSNEITGSPETTSTCGAKALAGIQVFVSMAVTLVLCSII